MDHPEHDECWEDEVWTEQLLQRQEEEESSCRRGSWEKPSRQFKVVVQWSRNSCKSAISSSRRDAENSEEQ